MYKIVLLRHGESTWNKENRFTGWTDVDLTEKGVEEAWAAGHLLRDEGFAFDVAFTSVLKRANKTLNIVLEALSALWLPVEHSWRLNERHYGDLTGQNKAEATARFGEDQVKVWRRSYDTPPPPISDDNAHNPNTDSRYAHVPADVLPTAECLADVVERMLPYWFDVIVPDLDGSRTVLVAAHGNSLRALVKHLDGIGDDEISGLDIPTGVPLVYQLDGNARPIESKPVLARALGDPEAIKAAAEAVARQATTGGTK